MKTILSHKASETRRLARRLSKCLPLPATVALWGELGTGKTQFVKGLAEGFGIKQSIQSPTFLLYKEYPFKHQRRPFRLCHFDLYRLTTSGQTRELGLNEILGDPNCLNVIEWPGLIKRKLPKHTYSIFFTHGRSSNERKIQIPSVFAKCA